MRNWRWKSRQRSKYSYFISRSPARPFQARHDARSAGWPKQSVNFSIFYFLRVPPPPNDPRFFLLRFVCVYKLTARSILISVRSPSSIRPHSKNSKPFFNSIKKIRVQFSGVQSGPGENRLIRRRTIIIIFFLYTRCVQIITRIFKFLELGKSDF